jgi:hypothetical protein
MQQRQRKLVEELTHGELHRSDVDLAGEQMPDI